MFKRMLLVLTLVAAGLFAAPAPAQAVYSDCAAYQGTICFHQHADYSGAVWRQYPWQIPGCINMTDYPGWNDRASTAFNWTSNSYALYLYQHVDCGGYDFILSSGQQVAFTGSISWWNDRVSSIYVQAL